MNYLGFFQRLVKKGSSKNGSSPKALPEKSGEYLVQKKKSSSSRDQDLLYFDFFYQLSYMSAISTAGIARNRIFEYSAQLPGKAAPYFQEIQRLSEGLGYDYAEACRLKGESVEDEILRSLLLRLSDCLSSGESEAEFLGREADVLGTNYTEGYERKLESLKQWTDAFSALIISGVLVIIIGVISTMIWKTDMLFILSLVGLTIGITIVGVWLISLMSPKEVVTLPKPSSREQQLAHIFLMTLLPAAVVVALFLIMRGAGLGWIMLLSAMLIFPVGYLSTMDDRKITRRDQEIGAFLRSLGGASSAIGTSITDAIGRLDLRSLPALSDGTMRLKVRLQTGILSSLCWQRFVLETGSMIVNRSVGMFRDAMALGAEAEDAGKRASAYAERLSLLRARRKLVSKPFGWLAFSMHGAVVLLLLFVTEVMTTFGDMIGKIETEIPGAATSSAVGSFLAFDFAGLQLLNALVVPVILVLTAVNAVAPKMADGGHNSKLLYNLSITMGLSGACLIMVPHLTAIIFAGVR
ncbi:archaellar assembly protein FlaJ [Dehalococcoidia bacterium]|nr:archaellar assembly protein FlaJ [Dehalococcoidia bacterium]